MRKITKKDQDRLADLARKVKFVLNDADEVLSRAQTEVQQHLDRANELKQEAYGILEDINCEQDDYYDTRSEKWQEGDAGSAYSDWKTEIEQVMNGLDCDITVEIPNEVERPDWIAELEEANYSTEPSS